LARPESGPEHHEAQEPGTRLGIPRAEVAGPHVAARLLEERVERVRLEQAALDVEHRVVPIRLVEPDRRGVGRPGHGELHLVAIAVERRGGDDRTKLERAEAAEALEAVRDLLGLVRELGGVGDVLQPAASAPTEVGTRRFDSVRRRRLDRLDDTAGESRADFDEPDPDAVARHPAPHEDHVAVDATDAFAAEREVVDAQRDSVSAPGPAHGSHTIKSRHIEVNLAGADLVVAGSRARYDGSR